MHRNHFRTENIPHIIETRAPGINLPIHLNHTLVFF
jgi:hypothetical protein